MSGDVDAKARHPTYQDTNDDYPLPNDTYEQSRLEDQAAGFFELMHNNVIHAPITAPTQIVDVGCGTGIQTCLLANLFPASHVYGIDLTPVPARPKPANVEWIQGDIRKLMHDRIATASVDLVFSRLLIQGMPDWQGYVNDVIALLKPGGWVEVQEYDLDWISHPEGQVISREWDWLAALRKQAGARDWDLNCGTNMKKYLERAGFVGVRAKCYPVPNGTWAVPERPESERIGRHSAREYKIMFHHVIARMLEGVEDEERTRRFQAEIAATLGKDDRKIMPFTVTIGRKAEV